MMPCKMNLMVFMDVARCLSVTLSHMIHGRSWRDGGGANRPFQVEGNSSRKRDYGNSVFGTGVDFAITFPSK